MVFIQKISDNEEVVADTDDDPIYNQPEFQSPIEGDISKDYTSDDNSTVEILGNRKSVATGKRNVRNSLYVRHD